MIQRIQTVYLLLVTGLLIAAMCMPLGYFTGADAVQYTLMPAGVSANNMFQ